MISIVHIVWTLDVGGLEQVVLDLTRRRDETRFTSRVICMAEPGALAPQFTAAGVALESLGPSTLSSGARLWRLIRRLQQLRPDVVHTHNVKPHIHGTIAAKLAGVPVVVNTKHGRNYPSSRLALSVDRMLSPACDCMVAVSDDAAAIATDIERMPAGKVRVIHNGIDLPRYTVARCDAMRLRRVVTVARLHPIKDQATLLRALRIVVDQDSDFHLTIAGDGPSRLALDALCIELGLTRHVTLLGYRSDVPAVLAAAGQFVLPSLSEGVSLTLLEAMATALPVVATRVGGTPEIVEDGATGWLVPAGEPGAIAEAMLRLARHPAQAARMGRAGRSRVEQRFSLVSTVSHYQDLYSGLLDSRARIATAPGEPELSVSEAR
jgi:sugar transferase (PEP-CTERM/EpsH1 system associated)